MWGILYNTGYLAIPERGQVTACLEHVAENFSIGQEKAERSSWAQRQCPPGKVERGSEGGLVPPHVMAQDFHPPR